MTGAPRSIASFANDKWAARLMESSYVLVCAIKCVDFKFAMKRLITSGVVMPTFRSLHVSRNKSSGTVVNGSVLALTVTCSVVIAMAVAITILPSCVVVSSPCSHAHAT